MPAKPKPPAQSPFFLFSPPASSPVSSRNFNSVGAAKNALLCSAGVTRDSVPIATNFSPDRNYTGMGHVPHFQEHVYRTQNPQLVGSPYVVLQQHSGHPNTTPNDPAAKDHLHVRPIKPSGGTPLHPTFTHGSNVSVVQTTPAHANVTVGSIKPSYKCGPFITQSVPAQSAASSVGNDGVQRGGFNKPRSVL